MEFLLSCLVALFAYVIVILPLLPLGNASVARRRGRLLLCINLALFAGVMLIAFCIPLSGMLMAGETGHTEQVAVANSSASWGYMAAALATGMGSIGAGIAVAAAAPAAIGALAEDSSTFGKAMIFVGLGEGLAIFGLLVSILILQQL